MPVRIPIMFREGEPPFVAAEVLWGRTGVSAPVNFVVDTGAFDIALSEDDATGLGADVRDLAPSRSPMEGIGGLVESLDMSDVAMVFVGDGGTRIAYLDSLRVMVTPRTGKRGDDIPYIPSLLGRDFMERNRFVLFWDFDEAYAYLEIKD